MRLSSLILAALSLDRGSWFAQGQACDPDDPDSKKCEAPFRFNKVSIMDDADIPGPIKGRFQTKVKSMSFPLSEETALFLRLKTSADSVVIPGDLVTPGDFQLYGDNDPEYWLKRTRNNHVYPGGPKYWKQLHKVVKAQIARRDGKNPSDLNRWPDIWEDKTKLEDIAKAVDGEYPAFHQAALIGVLLKDGIKMNRDLTPFRSVVDFIGKATRLAAINTWAFDIVAPINFMLKWHVGMPRPEEVAWMIYNDKFEFEGKVPDELVKDIKKMKLTSAASFTAYPNGSPTHPSYPAMHSAGSTVSYWLPAIAELTSEQYCEALRVDFAVSYGRTIAGVHYPMDNIAGLNLGHQIIKKYFPAMMAERYGYNAKKVEARLRALNFNWLKFDPEACTINEMPAGDFLSQALKKGEALMEENEMDMLDAEEDDMMASEL